MVGQVIAAVPELRARGVTRPAFMALVAIAEKCHPETRASVPLSWIQNALYGASTSTARRAIKELVAAELVRVVLPGFRNRFDWRAPVYELLAVGTAMDTATEVAETTAMTTPRKLALVKTGSSCSHSGSSCSHSSCSCTTDPTLTSTDAALTFTTNVSSNVSSNGRGAAPKQKPARRKTESPVASDWYPPAELIAKMADKYPLLNISDEIDAFKDKAIAKGWTYVDHNAGFRTWLRNADKYRERDRRDGAAGQTTESAYERKKRIAREVFDALAPAPSNPIAALELDR